MTTFWRIVNIHKFQEYISWVCAPSFLFPSLGSTVLVLIVNTPENPPFLLTGNKRKLQSLIYANF